MSRRRGTKRQGERENRRGKKSRMGSLFIGGIEKKRGNGPGEGEEMNTKKKEPGPTLYERCPTPLSRNTEK